MHEITETDNAMYVGKPAWHGLGTVVPEANARTFVRDAGIGDEILERPLYDGDMNQLEGWKAIVHSGNGNVLNVARNTYKVIQPAFLQEVCNVLADDGATPEAGFSMNGGKELAVLLNLNAPLVLPSGEDHVVPYAIMHTSHDGTAALTLSGTTIRVQCKNMLRMAFGCRKAEGVYRITHKGNVESEQETLLASLSGIRRQLEEFEARASLLCEVKVSEQDRRDLIEGAYRYINDLEELPQGGDSKGEKSRLTRWKNFQAESTLVYHGPTCDNIRGTAWGVMNSMTEVLEKSNSKDRSASRVNGTISRKREDVATYITETILS